VPSPPLRMFLSTSQPPVIVLRDAYGPHGVYVVNSFARIFFPMSAAVSGFRGATLLSPFFLGSPFFPLKILNPYLLVFPPPWKKGVSFFFKSMLLFFPSSKSTPLPSPAPFDSANKAACSFLGHRSAVFMNYVPL